MAATVQIERIRMDEITIGDAIVGRHTRDLYEVVAVTRRHDVVRVETVLDSGEEARVYMLLAEHVVNVDRSHLVTCERCSGSGTYCWGGTVNGVPVHTGECFRCGGKGQQDAADRKRNLNYDRYGIRL